MGSQEEVTINDKQQSKKNIYLHKEYSKLTNSLIVDLAKKHIFSMGKVTSLLHL